jgi:hypothetical protein
MGAFRNDELGVEDPPSAAVTRMPWIDIHQHGQTMSWGDRERFALPGCEAAVFVAAAGHYAPYRPTYLGTCASPGTTPSAGATSSIHTSPSASTPPDRKLTTSNCSTCFPNTPSSTKWWRWARRASR